MERLTFRASDGTAQSCEPINCLTGASHDALRAVLDRLAAYEDTGLTPEDIRTLANMEETP